MPFFSIITPLYNKGSFFEETWESVIAQTFADWEWIIIDDGSTDEGPVRASDAARLDGRITLVSQPNAGPCSARNRGIRDARGEWVLFLDADDFLEKNYLELLFHCCRNSDSGIHAGGWAEYDAALANRVAFHRPAGYATKNTAQALVDAAIAFAPWHPTSAIVRRSLLKNEFLWDEKMNRLVTEDTVFWWRLIVTYPVKMEDFCGVRYRRGTEGCRDMPGSLEKWSESLFYALQSNVDFWICLGNRLTAAQASNLVTVLTKNCVVCNSKTGSDEIMLKICQLVDRILRLVAGNSIKLLVIRWLGSRNFFLAHKLLRCGKKLKPISNGN
jgi:glycosyltransferase involved in cell wall biosynthesis